MEQDNPATPGQDYYQWEVSGTIDRYISGKGGLELSDSMDVTAGASGSPVYYSQNNDTYFTGVLAGSIGGMTVAAAMDEDSYNWILGIVQQDGYYTDYTPA
jgi:V8-like Glu-specific endopeptidase